MTLKELKKSDVDNFLIGLKILGTGGGGDAEWGKIIFEHDYNMGRRYTIVEPEDVPDDAAICCGGILGSVKEISDMSYADVVAQWEDDFPLVQAIRMLEKIKGRKMDYLITFESGCLNAMVMMSAAARLGISMVNADMLGRSAPETQMTSALALGINLYPMPFVDMFGNVNIVQYSSSPVYADEIGRQMALKGGGLGANAHYFMNGKELKSSCILHTMSRALDIGNAVKESKAPIQALCEKTNGNLAISGKITKLIGEDVGGFYIVTATIEGSDEFKGSVAKLVIKNETMALWIDDKLRIMFPDHAYMLHPDNGLGIASVELCEGMSISIVCAPCDIRLRECMKTKHAAIAFGPDRYGHPELLRYKTLEELNSNNQ